MQTFKWTMDHARSKILENAPTRFGQVFTHGTLRIGLYEPRGEDPQEPHAQDEVYVVMRGSGTFENDGQLCEFSAGDALFVPAGVQHRFATFSDDLSVWVIFYGPAGGESNQDVETRSR